MQLVWSTFCPHCDHTLPRIANLSFSTGSFKYFVAIGARRIFSAGWYERARQKVADAWLDITTLRPDPAGPPVAAETQRLREAAQARLRAEARQTCIGAPAGLEARVNAIGLPDATNE